MRKRGDINRDQEADSELLEQLKELMGDLNNQTLQSMLASVKMRKPIEEEEIPPPVAIGCNSAALQDSTAPITKGGLRLQLPFAAASSNDTASSHTYSQPEVSLSGVKDMVLSRQREFRLAAVQAKRTGDMELAKRYYKTAKKLDLMAEASIKGECVDISSLPPPPDEGDVESQCSPKSLTQPLPRGIISETALERQADCDSSVSPVTYTNFEGSPTPTITVASPVVLEQDHFPDLSNSLPVCSEPSDQYRQILEVLDQQHKRCLCYCQQFTHMGKVTETARFESLAEECVRHMEVLRQAQARGQPVPQYLTQQRSFSIYRIIPTLTGSDMVLTVIKGINLPVPAELCPNDMDISVRFEFAFPSSEDAQRDQTRSVRNSTCPEFNEHFKLHIKRGHRGFKRVIQSKGIRFEIIHKGGLFKTDKVIGSAIMKLDSLETLCETRQLIEVLSRRKATGAFLEVEVRIREPLGGPQLHTVTEPWLILHPLSLPTMAAPKHTPQTSTGGKVNSSSSICRVL
ncbi:coiled-coil and C2 domain-containing protein 1A-like [Osmerus eperlanus]|uniref:coiled-coil and C2 domain-containing protein 1A-like n=1 Tax=Osmerus eperlanus TaxID=29151 RepID=UPI002E154B3C